MPEQIVVGYDGSENSERALDWAIQEAGTLAGELRVVVSMGRPVAVDPSLYGPFLEAIEEEADKVAAAAVTRARDAGVPAVAVVERGDRLGQQGTAVLPLAGDDVDGDRLIGERHHRLQPPGRGRVQRVGADLAL